MIINQQSTKKNYILQLLYQFLILVIPLVLSPYLTRTIGKTGLGVYTYSNSIARYFVILSMLGINRYGQRTVASSLNDETVLRKRFWSLYTVHAVFSLIAIGLYLCFILFFVNSDKTLYLIQTIYVLSALFDLTWFFQGVENFRSVVIKNTFVKVIECVLIFTFVKDQSDLWKYALITTGGLLLGQMVLLPQAVKLVKPTRFSFDDFKNHIKPLFVFAVAVVAAALYTVFDKTLLGILATVEDVAVYEYSHKIINIPQTILGVAGTVFYPKICRLVAEENVESQKKFFNYSTILTCFIGFGSIFGLLAVADPLSNIYYGKEFAACGRVIKLFTPLIFIVGFGDIIRTQYLIPNKKESRYVKCLCFNAVINIALSTILIPQIGIYGAIAGTTAAEIFGLCYQMSSSAEIVTYKSMAKEAVPFIMIGFIMYGLIVFLQNLMAVSVFSLLVQVGAGIVIYCGLSILYLLLFKRELVFCVFKRRE